MNRESSGNWCNAFGTRDIDNLYLRTSGHDGYHCNDVWQQHCQYWIPHRWTAFCFVWKLRCQKRCQTNENLPTVKKWIVFKYYIRIDSGKVGRGERGEGCEYLNITSERHGAEPRWGIERSTLHWTSWTTYNPCSVQSSNPIFNWNVCIRDKVETRGKEERPTYCQDLGKRRIVKDIPNIPKA